MNKHNYTAKISFTSNVVKTRQDFELLLKPYKRNTFLNSITVTFGPYDDTRIDLELSIQSKNSKKANTTLDLICEEIKYYSGFNCVIWNKELKMNLYYKTWINPRSGERQVYAKYC
jgi:hypothetical protein